MLRTTIFLPDELHDELRDEAFRARLSMAAVIRLRIQAPVNAPGRAPSKRKAVADPLLQAAGICRGAVISANIDDALYGDGS